MAHDGTYAESTGTASWLSRLRAVDWITVLPVWLFAAWAAILVFRGHLPYILQPGEQSLDEGYAMAIGQRMLHGRMLPYVDGAAHTGPIFLYLGALIAAFGEFSWLPMRIACALGFTMISVLLFACGRRAGHPFAGAIAATGTPLYVTLRMGSCDAIPYNAELPAVLFTLAGLYAGLRALEDEQRPISSGWLFTAGVFTALGGLSKQIAAAIVLPVLAYVIVHLLARRDAPRRRLILTFLAGGAAVVGVVFGHLALGHVLRDAYYYLVTYNRFPYMDPYRWQPLRDVYMVWMMVRPFETAMTLGAMTWGFGQLYAAWVNERSWLRALRSSSFDWMVAAMALGGVIGARAARREYDHYYIMAVPGFSLLIGIFFERAMANITRPRASAVYQVLMFAPLLLVGELALKFRHEHLVGWSKQHHRVTDLVSANLDSPLCKYIRAHSKPADRLFVWGFRPGVHVSCARLPATRYVYSTLVAGYVPGGERNNHLQDEQYVVPGSRETLARELAETKPPVIVESPGTVGGRMLRNAGPAWDYVEAHYQRDQVIDSDVVYLRNDIAARSSSSRNAEK